MGSSLAVNIAQIENWLNLEPFNYAVAIEQLEFKTLSLEIRSLILLPLTVFSSVAPLTQSRVGKESDLN